MLLSSYRDSCFLLMVDYRYERENERVKKLVEGKGVDMWYEFVDGKGHELPNHLYSHFSLPAPPGWQDGPASYNHFHGIQTIIRIAKTRGMGKFLLVEDDIEFTPEFDEMVEKVHEQVPPDWDMLYYGANHTGHRTRQIAPNILRCFGSACTHCVAFRHTIYDAILSLPADRTIDWNIANRLHDKFGCYAAWPSIAVQKPGYSLLWKQKVDYSELWKNKGTPV